MKKKLNFLILLVLLIGSISCEKDNSIPDEQSYEIVKLNFDSKSQMSKSDELDLYLEATFDKETETLIKYNASNDLLNLLKLSQNELDKLLLQNMGESFYLNEQLIVQKGEHSDCISGCNDKFTDDDGNKIKGRGACKFNCWVDTVKDIIVAVAPAVIAAL